MTSFMVAKEKTIRYDRNLDELLSGNECLLFFSTLLITCQIVTAARENDEEIKLNFFDVSYIRKIDVNFTVCR